MTERQRAFLDALQAMLVDGESTIAWKVCERAGFAQGTLAKWKREHAAQVAAGEPSIHQDFFDEERAIRQVHRDQSLAQRALEPEIVEPEVEEEMPEVLVAYLSALEKGLEETGKLDRFLAYQEITPAWQVNFDDIMDALDGGHKAAARRYRQLRRRTTVRLEDKLRGAAATGTRSQDNALALQILRVDDPEKWNPKVQVNHVHQLEEGDRALIEGQRGWFKDLVRKIPASTGA